MPVSEADVKKMGHLARLAFSPTETSYLTGQLANILQLFTQIEAIDTNGIAPMVQALNAPQRLREDVITESDNHVALLKLAPQSGSDLYLVPQVIE
jgi:aspartyl-tRNA(Asn)/glutamyl-tRNA(Gln) amidotransferase subunit C